MTPDTLFQVQKIMEYSLNFEMGSIRPDDELVGDLDLNVHDMLDIFTTIEYSFDCKIKISKFMSSVTVADIVTCIEESIK